MKNSLKQISALTTFMLAMILLIGCSTSPKPIKPNTLQSSPVSEDNAFQVGKEGSANEGIINVSLQDVMEYKSMSFPVTENPVQINSQMTWGIVRLNKEIKRYHEVNGKHPDSISSLVNSGFLLWWPRNPIDGSPIKVVSSRDLEENQSDYGSFKYDILDDSYFQLSYTCIDKDAYVNSETTNWITRKDQYGYHKETELQIKQGVKVRRRMSVMGGTKPVYEVDDYDKRLLYSMCGQLVGFLAGRTNSHYTNAEVLPISFNDALDNRFFIIKENFESYAKMLKDSGGDFRWGFDSNNLYISFDIDNERLMKLCLVYGPLLDSPSTGGIQFDCNFEDLDTSSPMVSAENLIQIKIPEEYLISIKDIPLSDIQVDFN